MMQTVATRRGMALSGNAVVGRMVARRPAGLASVSSRASMCTSMPRYAAVDDKPHHPFMDKLMDSPQAMQSITKLMDMLEKKGVDVKSGKPPSMMQMAKIAMDGDIRTATGEVMSALREAGIDVSPEKMQEILSGKTNFFERNDDDGKKEK